MATNWTLYNKRLNINGTTKRERDLQSLQDNITEKLPDSLSCKAVKINGIDRQLSFTQTEKGYDINSLPNETFSIGDYVVYKTITFLVTKKHVDDEAFTSGSIEECNFILKFQSPTGTILSYPCITSNKTSGSGESSDKFMTLGDGMKSVKLPYDESTILLHNSDEKTYRFFLDLHPTKPVPYALTYADTTTYHYGDKGLIELIVKEDKINMLTDRIDLGICDYFEPTVIPDPVDPEVPTEIVTITSDATDNNVILGITHAFSATFKNELGADVSGVVAVYSVDNTYGGKVTLIDNGDGTATVTVGDYTDTQLCTEKFTLTCYDAAHGFEATVLLTIVGMF